MRRVIRGARYDTSTARSVARRITTGLHGVVETLYTTVRRRHFLHGVGGALTAWGRIDYATGELVAGENIRPLTAAQAAAFIAADDTEQL